MKSNRLVIAVLISSLMLACNLSIGNAPLPPAPSPEVVVVTQIVTVEVPPVESTATTAPNAAPTAEPTSTPTPTPSDPMVTPLKDPVNCRYGPSVNYEQVFALKVDAFAPVTGKSSDGGWWQVQIPDVNNQFCWVAASVVVSSGDLGGIQTVSAPVSLIKDVKFQLKPVSINLGPGCVGPFPTYSFMGTVFVNGPIEVNWQIETEQNGRVSEHTLRFSKFGSQDLSYNYTPSSWKKGNFWVRLVITSPTQILKEVTYQVKCE